MVRAYERRCGPLAQYGMKHMRSLANICNVGVGEDSMAKVASQACATVAPSDWPAHPPSPGRRGGTEVEQDVGAEHGVGGAVVRPDAHAVAARVAAREEMREGVRACRNTHAAPGFGNWRFFGKHV